MKAEFCADYAIKAQNATHTALQIQQDCLEHDYYNKSMQLFGQKIEPYSLQNLLEALEVSLDYNLF
jgi:hypothetical protein